MGQTELDRASAWTEPMAQSSWTLAFLLGLMKTILGFFHNGMDRDETPGSWALSFISTLMNRTATPHPLVGGPTGMLWF